MARNRPEADYTVNEGQTVQSVLSFPPHGAQVQDRLLPKVAGVGGIIIFLLLLPESEMEAFNSTPPSHSCSLGYFK